MPDKITFKTQTILGGIAVILIPFLIAGTIITLQLSRSLLEMSKERAVHLAKDLSTYIDLRLRQEIKLASTIAAQPAIVEAALTGDFRPAQKSLSAINERIGKDYFSILLLDRNGAIQADPSFEQIGLNLSGRDYFQKAKKGLPSVSGPLRALGWHTKDTPIIVVSVPILHERESLGVVAIIFDLDLMVQMTSKTKFGETGYGFIVNDQGQILIHPEKASVLGKSFLNHPENEEVRQILMSNKTGSVLYYFEGSDKIVGFSPVALTGWIAAFAESKAEIMIPVNQLLTAIFTIGMSCLALTVAGIVLFSSRLSNPVEKMTFLLKQLTRNSSEMILQIGLDRKVFHANEAFETITGQKMEEVLYREPVLDNPGKVPAEAIWKVLEKGSSWSGRVTLKGKRPEPVTLDVMIVPLMDEKGAIHGYVEIGRDVTAELLVEKRLQQGQKLEAIGTLAGGIAHDFNNILSGIFGYAELALMKKERDDETQKYIRGIMQASERARSLVSQILTFSRQTEIQLRPLQPKTVMKEALTLLRASIPATIEIRTRIESDAHILADPTQIHQVLMNLLTNAAHAIGDKTGSVELELVDFAVDEAFVRTHPGSNPGNHVLVRISDTGVGMPPEVLDKVFEPFFTTKPQGKGTGLGLSMVHGIVKQLGGTISVQSEKGKGATFNILIPATENEKPATTFMDFALEKGNARVAVVDDEPDIITIQQSILSNLGYRVSTFTDARAALESIVSDPDRFDIVITDYTMPNLTGLELARRLRDAGIDIPLILITGHLIKEIEAIARQTGIAEFITKPIDSYRLTSAIQRILESRAGSE